MKKKEIIKEYKFLWKNNNNNIDYIPKSIKECNRDIDFKEFDLEKFEIFDSFYEAACSSGVIPSYRCNLPKVREKRVRLLKSLKQFSDSVNEMAVDEIKEVKVEDKIGKNELMLFMEKLSNLMELYGEYTTEEKQFLPCFALEVAKNSSKFTEYYYSLRQSLFNHDIPKDSEKI